MPPRKTQLALLHRTGAPAQDAVPVQIPVRNGDFPDVVVYDGVIYLHGDDDWRVHPYHYFEARRVHVVAVLKDSGN